MKKHPKVQKNVIPARTNRQIADGANSARPPTFLAKAGAGTELQKAEDVSDQRAQALTMLLQAGGVEDPDLAARIIDQVNYIQAPWSFGDPNEGLRFAIEMMSEMKPENVTEAFLAVQMVGVHHASLAYLRKAAFSEPEPAASNVAIASRLMRLFAEQTAAMARLKGKVGQQSVTVNMCTFTTEGRPPSARWVRRN